MRSSETQKQIDRIPELKLLDLKLRKKSGHVVKYRNSKLWSEHIVKNGVERYWIFDLNDKVIKRGVAK